MKRPRNDKRNASEGRLVRCTNMEVTLTKLSECFRESFVRCANMEVTLTKLLGGVQFGKRKSNSSETGCC